MPPANPGSPRGSIHCAVLSPFVQTAREGRLLTLYPVPAARRARARAWTMRRSFQARHTSSISSVRCWIDVGSTLDFAPVQDE
eukprot:4299889-Pyramimonas_sp.AAC.1